MAKKILQSLLVLCLTGFIIYSGNYFLNQTARIPSAQAGASDNISGYAWSENVGWISFNSISDGSSVDYGVNLDTTTGNLSGYAWSETVGWIDFDPPSPYPSAPDHSAQVDTTNLGTGNASITGWAKVLSANGNGSDGWIKFTNTYIDSSGNLHGWAWGSNVVGWISFNSADSGASGGSDYKVVYQSSATLTVNCNSSTISVDQTTQCQANYDPDGSGPQPSIDVSDSTTWTSFSPSIATIDTLGLVTAVSAGTANMSATHNEITTPFSITVNSATHSKWHEIIPW